MLAPDSSAGLRLGSAAFSWVVAGVRYFPKVVKSTRNGCWARSESVETASVEGDCLMVFS